MIPGSVKYVGNQLYFVTNSSGTLEKLPKLKWYAELYIGVMSGIGKPVPIPELRRLSIKHKRR